MSIALTSPLAFPGLDLTADTSAIATPLRLLPCPVHLPGDADYDRARGAWAAAADQRPAAVVEPGTDTTRVRWDPRRPAPVRYERATTRVLGNVIPAHHGIPLTPVTADDAAIYRKIAQLRGGTLISQMFPTYETTDFLVALRRAGL